MLIEELALPGVYLFTPKRHGDDRGFFSETFSKVQFAEAVPGVELIQDNHSFSKDMGVIRGLHFQLPPHAQGKLVRVPNGRVLDVVVDLRVGSPTYGQHLSVELSGENWKQLWVPAGFAHGFCTLEANTEFCYKVSAYYAPESDSGIIYNDPDLAIDWPVGEDKAILSAKDQKLQKFRDFTSPYIFNE
ncbi:dTDP-4-dehydrorhamnose 3,5-epimerase [Kordiimonas pumila]|uniref:dTDP-4-dehydrorhamnose 3,5-epimerase n=1 Tax=Kordiimonas pumila TaxID=2161677 RepID=A0ABV7D488_9PROT|nr:dTDP-4-dehydrorhamnose 3,5-epimerase [Kordiimonas pumila]